MQNVSFQKLSLAALVVGLTPIGGLEGCASK